MFQVFILKNCKEKGFPTKSSAQTDDEQLHEGQRCQGQRRHRCQYDYARHDVHHSGRSSG